MKNWLVLISINIVISFATKSQSNVQSDEKLPIPVSYKDLQKALNTEGRIALYNIEFEKDLIKTKRTAEPQIKEIARLLNTNKRMKIYIVVHSDNNCYPEDCIKVSQKRAELLRDILADDYMVNVEQIFPKGAGATCPLANPLFEENKSKNRRVELVLQ